MIGFRAAMNVASKLIKEYKIINPDSTEISRLEGWILSVKNSPSEEKLYNNIKNIINYLLLNKDREITLQDLQTPEKENYIKKNRIPNYCFYCSKDFFIYDDILYISERKYMQNDIPKYLFFHKECFKDIAGEKYML